MSWTRERKAFVAGTVGFTAGSLGLWGVGWWTGLLLLELTGFFLIAGTFVPLPFDLYLLRVSPLYGAVALAVFASGLNTIAVLVERWFLLHLMAAGRGRAVMETVRGTRLSAWFRKAPFVMVFIGGFTIIPFEPVRFLAVVNDYSVGRYTASTFLGRGIRFWMLAALGNYLARLQWLSVVLTVLFIGYLVALLDVRNVRKMKGMLGRLERNGGGPTGARGEQEGARSSDGDGLKEADAAAGQEAARSGSDKPSG